MKRTHIPVCLIAAWSLAALGSAHATEFGHVLSSRQVVETVGTPRRVCSTEPMLLESAPTGGGALAGAVVGGLAGNSIGGGGGQVIATMLGFLAGSVVGDRIEASRAPQLFDVEHCSVQSFTENRTVGWDVEYEYAGRQYAARLPSDPGATVPLEITAAGAAPLATASLPIDSRPDGAVPYPSNAYPGAPYPGVGYPVYSPRPVYVAPPVSIGLGFTYFGGRGRWR